MAGSIENVARYSDDMAAVDFRTAFAFGTFTTMFFFTVFQLTTAVYMVKFLGTIILPLVYVYFKAGNFFLAPSREVSRLWEVGNSPVLSHVNETEEGVTLLRTFGSDYVERALVDNLNRIDVINKIWFIMSVGRQWFQVRMQLLGCGKLTKKGGHLDQLL